MRCTLYFKGESASADHVAANEFPPKVRDLIREKGFLPQQIFNCDETGLYWKRMPGRTFIAKEEKKAPGFKVAKERLTLLLCANASGTFRCKPMLVYKSENPRVMKGKNKDHLPVFWRSNKTAWVTKTNFKEWFLKSFVPEVQLYLAKENLAFKILLLLDNCASHGDEVMLAHPDVEICFLPPNTTSLIQPMDQSVIATFKSYYLRHLLQTMVRFVNQHRECENFESENVVRSFWKKFSILDCLGLIEKSWQEISNSTLNASWSKLLPELVTSKESQNQSQLLDHQIAIQNVINLSQEVGGEGFHDLRESEILELVSPENEELTVAEVAEMVIEEKTSSSDDEGDDNDELSKHFHSVSLKKIMDSLQDAIEEAIRFDPVMTRSLHFQHNCNIAVQIYEDLFKEYRRKIKQTQITDFFL